jgi:Na+/proline symporter
MNGTTGILIVLLSVVVWLMFVAGWWKMFEKADEAGWKSIVPFYNTYTYFRIAGKSGWMFLLLLIPVVGFIVHFMVSIDLAKSFGKGAGYGVFLLGIFPIFGAVGLGFGEDKYIGTKHE